MARFHLIDTNKMQSTVWIQEVYIFSKRFQIVTSFFAVTGNSMDLIKSNHVKRNV